MWMYYKSVVLKCVSYSGLPEVGLREHKSKTSYFTYNRQQYLQREKTRDLWYMFVFFLVQAHKTQVQLKEGWAKKVLRRKQSRQHVACLRKKKKSGFPFWLTGRWEPSPSRRTGRGGIPQLRKEKFPRFPARGSSWKDHGAAAGRWAGWTSPAGGRREKKS